MPLSRLSARRNRDALIRQRASGTKSKAGQSKAASRHLNLWEAIRKTREELIQWEARIVQVDTLFQQLIVPREHRMTAAYSELTDALMSQFANTDHTLADRSLIGLWITDNLQSLTNHPFVNHSDRTALLDQWSDLISIDGPIENQLARLAQQYSLFTFSHLNTDTVEDSRPTGDGADRTKNANYKDDSENDDENDDDLVFDFGWHQKSPDQNNATAEKSTSSEDTLKKPDAAIDDSYKAAHDSDHQSDTTQDEEPDRETVDETVSVLENRLSVDRLFRQLARVLHPDREQDEVLKAEKHVLMSQCLKARQEKDINTLLTLYCEHVGELPDDLTDDSHEELVNALKLQLKQLQQELREKRFGEPLHAQIVERYGDNDNAICEQRFAQHAKSLDTEIRQVGQRMNQIKTGEGLQSALLERREIEQDRLAIDEITGVR